MYFPSQRLGNNSLGVPLAAARLLRSKKMKKIAGAIVLAGMMGFVSISSAMADAGAALKALDPDNDGTIDLAEAQAGGAKLFVTLDPDKDGTLDAKELAGRLDEAGLKAADPDNDGTLDAKEYAAVIEGAFKAANPDEDGTVDLKELESEAGQKLMKLVH